MLLGLRLQAQVPFECKGQYFVTLSFLLNSPSDLYEVKFINSGTVIFENIKENIGGNINAIGYRSTDNFIYGVDPDDLILYRLDATGTAYDLGVPDLEGWGYFAGDVSPDGKYLVLIGGFGDDEVLSLIDLEDPDFGTTNINLEDYDTRVFDIAFDPIEGVLYGFDSNNKRLLTINIADGSYNTSFPTQNQINSIGALFFDTFGNLFAYGGFSGGNQQNVLFRVNKQTGTLSFLADGPLASGNDGCSCPYTIKLEKTVSPDITLPCSEVEYTFRIANYSGRAQEGITLSDYLPDGFSISEIISNPIGGDLGQDLNHLELTNMTIPVGEHEIVVRVYIDELPPGIYKNQASLENLPVQLGGLTLSDNPFTFTPEDSTAVELLPLSLEFIEEEQSFCENDVLIIDATLLGAEILWDNGSMDPVREITEPGIYVVEASTDCETVIKTITVTTEFISLSSEVESYELELGEELFIDVDVDGSGLPESYLWSDPLGSSLDCYDCEDVTAFPLFDVTYNVHVTSDQGCEDDLPISVRLIKPRYLFAPNIFSPNGDGVNDFFYLFGNENTVINYLRIYDRWGNLVFSQEGGNLRDRSIGWDGTFNGKELQSAVFTWMAEVRYLDDFTKIETGDLTLIR